MNTIGGASGTHHLYLRTGTAASAIIRYGLTSNTSASAYCPIRFYVGGKVCYIASSWTYTYTYQSNYNASRTSYTGSKALINSRTTFYASLKTKMTTLKYVGTSSSSATRANSYITAHMQSSTAFLSNSTAYTRGGAAWFQLATIFYNWKKLGTKWYYSYSTSRSEGTWMSSRSVTGTFVAGTTSRSGTNATVTQGGWNYSVATKSGTYATTRQVTSGGATNNVNM